MTETKTYCDHCGMLIEKDYDSISVDIRGGPWRDQMDLCSLCYKKLTNIIDEFINNQK